MLVILAEARAVDGVLRTVVGIGDATGGGDDVVDRIGERLDREAPDVALEDRVVGRRIDFIYTPVIRLA